jgi:hypothetical protein
MKEMKVIESILKDKLGFNIEFAIKTIQQMRKMRKEHKK